MDAQTASSARFDNIVSTSAASGSREFSQAGERFGTYNMQYITCIYI